ncbi:HDOD domain-containing protein, partial [bacterium]|nr:HDOD domain-containing protein [bacterium]
MDLEKITAEIDKLSTLPNIVFKIMELTADKNSGAEDLVKVIQTDPSITTKVLRMVNAPYYAIANEIYDIRKAIVRLGFRAIREISLTVSVCDLFKSDDVVPDYKRSDLWKHLVGVAILAKMISERMNFSFSDQAFTAGLLHDIGIILMDQYCHKEFLQVMQDFRKNEDCICISEEKILSFDHQVLAFSVFKKSSIPAPIYDVMKNHHDPKKA